MAYRIRRVAYYYTVVDDLPGEAYHLLARLASLGVNLLAFNGVPIGPSRTQLALFPEDGARLEDAAHKAGLALDGPYHAFLVQGDDELGALAKVHARLYQARVNIFASMGVTDGQGSYGEILYVRADEFERAAQALEL